MRTSAMVPVGLALLIPALVFTLASCNECTTVGCDSGLEVRFSSAIPVGASVTASSQQYGARTVNCSSSGPCSTVFFIDFLPTEVSVTVDLPTGSHTTEFSPEYRTFQPNGEDCGPTCRATAVQMTW